ncbi:MAG: UDP-glucose/GDP-mannose dehydrogenase family protein [Oscillospiraceae bacterium]|nr:UDP-glucose/GDP-mannose dehydrogenase family protein [Oscillospiraceae bacterium]
MKIAIAGTGYVGLVTGVCLASVGHTVVCVDSDKNKITALNNGKPPMYETGVEEYMASCKGRLEYTCNYEAAYRDAQVIFICVGTPEHGDGYANLKYVYEVAEQIAETVATDCVVIVKSTVPIGTNDKLEKLFHSDTSHPVSIQVASNPEFLSQGTAIHDMLHGARIVVGVENEYCENVLRQVYTGFDSPIIVTDRRSAEMIKYASNNFLALKISFINEIANLCEIVDADIDTVSYVMGLDSRIGDKFLRSGIGYGGSCFPKDTKALHWLAKYHDYEIKTVKAAIEVNENQKLKLIKKARKYYKSLEGLTIAVLGLTFKPETDDLRDAPSLQNIPIMLDDGAKVNVWDPAGCENLKKLYPTEVNYCGSIEQAIAGSDVCFILTEWKDIREFDLRKYADLMKRAVVIDGRNCYSPKNACGAGIIYDSIGRKAIV